MTKSKDELSKVPFYQVQIGRLNPSSGIFSWEPMASTLGIPVGSVDLDYARQLSREAKTDTIHTRIKRRSSGSVFRDCTRAWVAFSGKEATEKSGAPTKRRSSSRAKQAE